MRRAALVDPVKNEGFAQRPRLKTTLYPNPLAEKLASSLFRYTQRKTGCKYHPIKFTLHDLYSAHFPF